MQRTRSVGAGRLARAVRRIAVIEGVNSVAAAVAGQRGDAAVHCRSMRWRGPARGDRLLASVATGKSRPRAEMGYFGLVALSRSLNVWHERHDPLAGACQPDGKVSQPALTIYCLLGMNIPPTSSFLPSKVSKTVN